MRKAIRLSFGREPDLYALYREIGRGTFTSLLKEALRSVLGGGTFRSVQYPPVQIEDYYPEGEDDTVRVEFTFSERKESVLCTVLEEIPKGYFGIYAKEVLRFYLGPSFVLGSILGREVFLQSFPIPYQPIYNPYTAVAASGFERLPQDRSELFRQKAQQRERKSENPYFEKRQELAKQKKGNILLRKEDDLREEDSLLTFSSEKEEGSSVQITPLSKSISIESSQPKDLEESLVEQENTAPVSEEPGSFDDDEDMQIAMNLLNSILD